jgi:hypothetical protein
MNQSYNNLDDPELGLLDDAVTEEEKRKKDEEFYNNLKEQELKEIEINKKKWEELSNPHRPDSFEERRKLVDKLPISLTNEQTREKYGFFYPPQINSPINFEPIHPEGLRQRKLSTPIDKFIPITQNNPVISQKSSTILPTTREKVVVKKKSICPPEGCNISGGIRRRRKSRKVRKSRKSKKSNKKSKRRK